MWCSAELHTIVRLRNQIIEKVTNRKMIVLLSHFQFFVDVTKYYRSTEPMNGTELFASILVVGSNKTLTVRNSFLEKVLKI